MALDDNTTEEKLLDLLAFKQREASELQQQIAQLNGELTKDAPQLNAAAGSRDVLKKEVESLATKVTVLDREIQDRTSEIAARGFESNQIDIDVSEKILERENSLLSVRDNVSELETALSDMRTNAAINTEKLSISSIQKENLNKEKQRLQKPIRSYEDKISRVSLPTDASFDDLISKKKDIEKIISEHNDALTQISTAEVAIDASELSAEHSRLTMELQEIEKEIIKVSERESMLKEWITTFTKVRTFLTRVRDTSISEYTNKYGPLASTIQSRLRSVYGFGEISLSSSGGKIAVTVERSDSQLRPIDYFSESQKQILVLSMFIASAITQNWSSFSPIFLDDPVTHFDDLNAYAFLGLIAGMLRKEDVNLSFQLVKKSCFS